VFKHPATSLTIDMRCSSSTHSKVSFRKWIPLGKDSNLRTIGFIPPFQRSVRDSVNGGKFESWVAVGSSSFNNSASTTTVRSSIRGNEKMKNHEGKLGGEHMERFDNG